MVASGPRGRQAFVFVDEHTAQKAPVAGAAPPGADARLLAHPHIGAQRLQEARLRCKVVSRGRGNVGLPLARGLASLGIAIDLIDHDTVEEANSVCSGSIPPI